MNVIRPCLWLNNQAEEAAEFYCSLFPKSSKGSTSRYTKATAKMSGQPEGAVMAVEFTLEDLPFLALNGGPIYTITPALSFTVWRKTAEEVDALWKELSKGGTVRMELGQYPWSSRYGWTSDRFGVEWQIVQHDIGPKITPTLLFVDKLFGRAEEAIDFYASIFPHAKIDSLTKDESGKSVMHSLITLNKQQFTLMDGAGSHGWEFSEGVSLMVNFSSPPEAEMFRRKISEGGSISHGGWLKDRFGVSWQVLG